MNKIPLIIKREYLTRIKDKTFIIMTIIGPVLMAALFIVPIWLLKKGDETEKTIGVYDKAGHYKNVLINTETIKFDFVESANLDEIEKELPKSGYFAFLVIPSSLEEQSINLYSEKQPGIHLKKYIKNAIDKHIELQKFNELGVKKEQVEEANSDIEIKTLDWKSVESSTELTMIIGFIAAIIIYIFIFMYGSQVMRGVIEEKTSRVIEVIISSVKPFELMAGKIIGIAMVALTQFILWTILTSAIIIPIQAVFLSGSQIEQVTTNQNISGEQIGDFDNEKIAKIINKLNNFDWGMLAFVFIFFFIGGYLLYASLFAAIGSAVDNETDTQQFMLPVTIPLILAFVASQTIIQYPDGQIAFWFSIIPFTSPIVMPIRIAYDAYAMWELAVSMILLILTFLGAVWFAAKIYRTGILMYGKKVTYKELWKWLRF